MSEWVLVPSEQTNDMVIGSWHYVSPEAWRETLAARPPIPRDVWDAMVERGARAMYETWSSARGFRPWVDGGNSFRQEDARYLARKAIRAALGNPVVEGDEP